MQTKAVHPKVIIPDNCHPWPHEIRTAHILADYGFKLTFIPESDTAKTPDVIIENRQYEMKAPISSKIGAVERNLKIASKKTKYIIFDSARMQRLSDKQIYRELHKQFYAQSIIKEIIFVDKASKIHFFTRKQ